MVFYNVAVIPEASLCNHIAAKPSVSYISSTQAKAKTCSQTTGLFDQEFSINAQPGQHLQLSLIDLSKFGNEISDHTQSEELGYILDTSTDKVFPIQQSGRSDSESSIAVTEGNTASIVLSSSPQSNFMISFKGKAMCCTYLLHINITNPLN